MKQYSIEIKWGLIFFAASLVWMWFEKILGWHGELINKHPIYTNLFAIVAILIFVLALRDKRKNYYNNSMTWKQGFVAGLIISIVVAVLSPLSQYITHSVITPEYFPNAISYSVENGKMNQEQAEAFFNLRSYIMQSTVGALVMGVLTSAIVALFLRKK